MAQKDIEIILTRQLASYLAVPIFLVDPRGNLLYYNEPAEAILGRRFEETGEMPASDWSTLFTQTDDEDNPIPPEELPLVIAFSQGHPAHRRFWICGLDGVKRYIEVQALPLIGQMGELVGAMAALWELEEPK